MLISSYFAGAATGDSTFSCVLCFLNRKIKNQNQNKIQCSRQQEAQGLLLKISKTLFKMWNPRGLILAVLALLVQVSVVYSVVLPLERAFPLNQPVQLSQLRARDRVRHYRILQGVVEFPVQGSSDPFLIG